MKLITSNKNVYFRITGSPLLLFMNSHPSYHPYYVITNCSDTRRDLKFYIFIQVLLSRISFFGPKDIPEDEKLGLQMYSKTAEYVMCSILPDSPTKTTKMTDGNFHITIFNKQLLQSENQTTSPINLMQVACYGLTSGTLCSTLLPQHF